MDWPAFAALREVVGDFPICAAAGLSLGEMTAHAAAGTFDFASGLKLVQKRGELMDEACAATSGGMAALIGAPENSVRQLAADQDVDVANINAPGQIVISGELAKVEAAVGVAREHGIRRATMLNVAGAYHSRLMETAYQKLGDTLLSVEMHAPRFPVVSNVDSRRGPDAAGYPAHFAGAGDGDRSLGRLNGATVCAWLRIFH